MTNEDHVVLSRDVQFLAFRRECSSVMHDLQGALITQNKDKIKKYLQVTNNLLENIAEFVGIEDEKSSL